VGGNIGGQTRVRTTATVIETGKGNFDIAIALSVILLSLTFAINFFMTRIQQREQVRWPRVSWRRATFSFVMATILRYKTGKIQSREE
jgi:hypothetical protein